MDVVQLLAKELLRCKTFDVRVGLAIQLAQDMDGHLVGLAPTGLVGLSITLEPAAMGPLHQLAVEAVRNEARIAEARFREACEKVGLDRKGVEAVFYGSARRVLGL